MHKDGMTRRDFRLLREKAIEMYREGKTTEEVMQETGLGTCVLQRIRLDHGILQKRHTPDTVIEILAKVMHTDKPYLEIEAETGISTTLINRWARIATEQGFTVPKRKRGRPRKESQAQRYADELGLSVEEFQGKLLTLWGQYRSETLKKKRLEAERERKIRAPRKLTEEEREKFAALEAQLSEAEQKLKEANDE